MTSDQVKSPGHLNDSKQSAAVFCMADVKVLYQLIYITLQATGGGDSSIRVWHRTSANRLSENVSMADITMPEILQVGR